MWLGYVLRKKCNFYRDQFLENGIAVYVGDASISGTGRWRWFDHIRRREKYARVGTGKKTVERRTGGLRMC